MTVLELPPSVGGREKCSVSVRGQGRETCDLSRSRFPTLGFRPLFSLGLRGPHKTLGRSSSYFVGFVP